MGYKITTYTAKQREKNLTNSIEIAEDMGFNSGVIEMYKSQLKGVKIEIKEDNQRRKDFKLRGLLALSCLQGGEKQ